MDDDVGVFHLALVALESKVYNVGIDGSIHVVLVVGFEEDVWLYVKNSFREQTGEMTREV